MALALGVLLLAGCTQGGATGDGKTAATGSSLYTTPPPAPEPTVGEELGSIAGVVTDDEMVPVSLATVTVVQTMAETRTDAGGKFTINDLAPGDYNLLVSRVGYYETARKVSVAAGEVTKADVVLKLVPVPDGPRHFSIEKKAYIKASWVLLTSTGNTYNSTGLASTFCDPCIFHLEYFGTDMKEVKPEVTWQPFAAQPLVNEDVWLQFFVKYTKDSDGTAAQAGYVKNGKALVFTEVNLGLMAKHNATRLKVHGALLGINFEHKPAVWTTFAFGAKLPEGFTALPTD